MVYVDHSYHCDGRWLETYVTQRLLVVAAVAALVVYTALAHDDVSTVEFLQHNTTDADMLRW